MMFNDLLRQYRLKEIKCREKDNLVARKVLVEYIQNCGELLTVTGNHIDDLLYNYFLVKNTNNGIILDAIMSKYNFNYSMSIHNAIYYLLGNIQDLACLNTDFMLWPGIKGIVKDVDVWILDTVLGKIKVSKASDIFKNAKSSYIFDKSLMGKCHERSYDFLKENKDDYQVVLSYMPNFFSGGHYHTYLESNTSILDIAANSYYTSKEDSDLVLNGRIIRKLDYSEIERSYSNLSKRIPRLKDMKKTKLLTLSLYYDYKDSK